MSVVRPKMGHLLAMAACVPFAFVLLLSPPPAAAQGNSQSEVLQGFRISPVPLNLTGKNRSLVGLGSYIVNAHGGCNDCHTWPNFADGGNPYMGQPEQINTAGYLAGGRPFGPFVSPNITPDENGLPAGLTFAAFKNTLRTGHDPDVTGRLLQVMPWPIYRNMTDRDLAAVYEFLRSIPAVQN